MGIVVPPVSTSAGPGLTVGPGQKMSASFANSFRVAAVAERLGTHLQSGSMSNATEFFGLCLSLARGIDYAVANNEVPTKAKDLPLLLKQVCQRKNDLFLQAAIMVLMISVKNACKNGWFSDNDSRELLALANEIGNNFCSPGEINTVPSNSHSIITTIMSRFYPQIKMGKILALLEAKPGYEAYMIDFHISKNTPHSPQEKIRLFVAQRDNTETSTCIISPQHVNFLLNGKGVERRTNVSMDTGPQMPTVVTAMLKYGTNLLQAVGQFNSHYIIAVAFMSVAPLPDTSALPDYLPPNVAAADPDSDIIEGPSRVSLNCPISYTRIKTPVKGHSCKHLQCFDYSNFIDINSRRPSWRCPHCNQHVCYSDIRVDQNMVKVLKEVGENVIDVIISADGSWKAVLESDKDTDQTCKETVNCLKETSERQEPATSSIGLPIVLDLTEDDDRMDAVSTRDIEDRKPSQVSLQSQPVAINLTMPSPLTANAVDQNVTHQVVDGSWSSVYFNQGPELAPANISGSSLINDAISPALNCNIGGNANNSLASLMQNPISASGNLQQSQLVNAAVNNEYGRLTNIPRHVNRTPVAVQALPCPSQTSVQQQRPRTNLNSENPNRTTLTSQSALPPANGFNMASNHMERQQQFLRSHINPHQQLHQDRPFISGQTVQQVAGLPTTSQLTGAFRASSGLRKESQNLNQQQALRMPQPRSQSPVVGRSPVILQHAQTQQGTTSQIRVNNTAGFLTSQQTRFTAPAPRPVQMTRQPPSVPVPLQASRGNVYSNTDATRTPAVAQRGNGAAAQVNSGTDGSVDLSSEQNWRPTGRMRGSLSGQAAAAYRDLIIQPTQPAQPPRPPVPSSSPSVPPHLQAFLAKSRNFHAQTPQ